MLRLLEEGEVFQSGDKMLSPVTGEFSDIPVNWVENKFKFSHKDDNTFSRHKIQVVRKLSDSIALDTIRVVLNDITGWSVMEIERVIKQMQQEQTKEE